MKSAFFVVAALFALAGCGDSDSDNPGNPDAAASPDANGEVDAGAGADAAGVMEATAFALGTDNNSTGILSRVGLPDLTLTQNVVGGVAASDSVVRAIGDTLYIVNRFGSDNLTVVNAAAAQFVTQRSTGAGSNPQDVAVVGDKIYVCAFNTGGIVILDRTDGAVEPGLIDISSYDADGVPNCSSIVESGGRLYATLGLLDDNFVSQGGKVIVIDPDTDSVVGDFDLTYKNPLGFIVATNPAGPFGGDLLAVTTEDFGAGNGCVERISTGDEPSSRGCLIENSALGGYASVLQVGGDTLWAAVSTSFTSSKLVTISPAGELDDTSVTPKEQLVTDFAVCPNGFVITNDGNSGTVKVYGSDRRAVPGNPIDIGLPPVYTNGMVCL